MKNNNKAVGLTLQMSRYFKAIVIKQFCIGVGLDNRQMEQRPRCLDSTLTNPSSIWSLSSYCYDPDTSFKNSPLTLNPIVGNPKLNSRNLMIFPEHLEWTLWKGNEEISDILPGGKRSFCLEIFEGLPCEQWVNLTLQLSQGIELQSIGRS